MTHIVVDASLWVARLVPQDVHYTRVLTWMNAQRAAGVTLISPALLLAEVAGAVSRRTGDAQLAHQAVLQITRLPGVSLVNMEQRLTRTAAQLAADWGLRGADSFYVATAHLLAIPLITLDADQQERARNAVKVEVL